MKLRKKNGKKQFLIRSVPREKISCDNEARKNVTINRTCVDGYGISTLNRERPLVLNKYWKFFQFRRIVFCRF